MNPVNISNLLRTQLLNRMFAKFGKLRSYSDQVEIMSVENERIRIIDSLIITEL